MKQALTSWLLLGSLLLAAPALQAQIAFSVGPQVGLSVATCHFAQAPVGPIATRSNYYRNVATTAYQAGFSAGAVGTLTRGQLTLQAGLLYAQQGYQLRIEDTYVGYTGGAQQVLTYTSAVRLNYLTLPLNLVFTQRAQGQGGQLFAGPYLSVLLGGQAAETVTSTGAATVATTYSVVRGANGRHPDTFYAPAVDAGLQAGGGYQYKRVLLQATYRWGLRNLAAEHPALTTNALAAPLVAADSPYQQRGFQFCLTYLVRLQG